MNTFTNFAAGAAIVAGLFLSAHSSQAMTYTYTVDDKAVIINAKGEIAYDEKAIFQKFMASLPADVAKKNAAFIFDSPGGNVYGAYDVAELIRQHNGVTGVDENGMCASACVLMFGAGLHKVASTTSHIGVHNVAMDTAAAPKDATREQIADLAKNKGVYESTGTLQYAQQLNMYQAPDHVVVMAIMTSSTDMYWLNATDAAQWNIDMVAPAPKPIGAPATTASK